MSGRVPLSASTSNMSERRPPIAKPLAVTIDTREPEHAAWRFSEEVVVTRAKLDSGDVAPTGFESVFSIERKALGDLVACCTWERPRFLRELERLRTYDFAAIIVEASLDDVERHNYRADVHPASVVGSVVAFHLDYGVPTIWAGTPTAAARMAERLMRRFVARHTAGAKSLPAKPAI